jgi:hypothetical protein
MTRWRGDEGLVGKILVIWLLIVAVLGIAVVDTSSIVLTHVRLSDAASIAAVAGANAYVNTRDEGAACQAVRLSLEAEAPGVPVGKNACVVDRTSGEVTVTLRQEAKTLLASRLPFTEDFVKVVAKETGTQGDL